MVIYRDIVDEILPWVGKEKILILSGSRQVGKTTILKYIQKQIENNHKSLFFSVDLEIGNAIFKEPKLFINLLKSELKENNKIIVFLDECQYIKDSGLFLKVCFDQLKDSVQFIVSSSSSLEISKNKEFLTGRKIEFIIYPLSFKEFISYKSKYNYHNLFGIDSYTELQDFYLSHKDDLEIRIIDYFNWGGYPEIHLININDRGRIIKEIVSTYLQKDIAGFLNISNLEGYNNLIRVLAGQIGNLVNVNELNNTLRLNTETINKYLSILTGTYIFHLVPPFFTNLRKEISKMKKIYISDLGFRRIILNNSVSNSVNNISGSEVENFIFTTLQNNFNNSKINYHRTISKSEVDFILGLEGEIVPIEVKYSSNYSKLPVSLKYFRVNYSEKVKKSIIITKDFIGKEQNTYYIPFCLFPFIKI